LFWLSGLACAIGLLVFGYQRLPLAQSQEPPKAAKATNEPYYLGSFACVTCHSQGPKQTPLLCRCTEVDDWKDKDKHTMAHELLKDKRAQKMGEALGWDVMTDPRCISCHGIPGTKEQFDQKNFVGTQKIGFDEAKIKEGITCTVCHGANKTTWVKEHGSPDERERLVWRARSREEKDKVFGMTDLWDPSKRAKLCLSCHIGNTAEKKFVTHSMYAAGHPPLPGVELATFSDEMPRHWQYLAEKDEDVQKLLNYDPKDASLEKTRLVLTSGLAAFRDSMQLLSTQAADDKAWPELAQFDCYACHHELKTPAWRQNRLPKGKPGRPQMREWPTALVKASLLFLGDKPSALAEHLKPLREEFDNTPFGNPGRVAAAADKVVVWADERLKALNAKKAKKKKDDPDQFERPLDRAGALTILCSLATLPPDETPDYDSARQIAWAIEIIYHELFPKKLSVDKEIEEQLLALRKQLKLNLPSGKAQTIVGQLGDSMRTLGDYDPNAFRDKLAALLKLLLTKA
jgi:hypothetical protein